MKTDRFKVLHIRANNLAPGVGLIRSNREGCVRTLPLHTVRLLQSLKGFASLREHVQSMSRATGRGHPGEEGTWLSLLRDLAEEGFLRPENDVRQQIDRIARNRKISESDATAIRRIGIPTASRPDYLKRAIETFSERTRRHGREVGFVVMDDSKEEAGRLRNVEVVRILREKANIDIKYVDRHMREAQAQEIIRKSGVPAEVVRFALFGPEGATDTYGAPRNALLLETSGEAHIQTDDDTTAEMLEVPCADNGLALSGKHQAEDCTMFRDHREIVETFWTADIDPLAIHERLLGKHPGAVIGEFLDMKAFVNIDETEESILDAIARPDARVAISFTGAAGDTGMDEFYHRLFPGDSEYEQLIENALKYDRLLRSRYVLRIAPRYVINNGLSCVSMSVGLDNRSLLPPFITCGRSGDTIFGTLLKTCFPMALKGYMPRYAIQHKPAVLRRPYQGSPEFPRLTSNQLLMYSIRQFARQPIGEGASALRMIGTMLMNLGEMQRSHFLEHTTAIVSEIVRGHVYQGTKALNEDEDGPDQWERDMLGYIDSALEAVEEPGFGVPSDLPGSISERLDTFQRRTVQFGKLLWYWPEMMHTSAQV